MRPARAAMALALALAGPAALAADTPPWVGPGDFPLPAWARSAVPKQSEVAVVARPGDLAAKRGTTAAGARMRIFATQRAPGCGARWIMVGPFAWICADYLDLSTDEPVTLAPPRTDNGLPFRYFFAGAEGAYGYRDLRTVEDDAPDQELERGFAVAVVGEEVAHGEAWALTRRGRYIAMRELVPARASVFRGARVMGGKLDVGWVSADAASVFGSPKQGKPTATKARFTQVDWHEERPGPGGAMVRVSEDGAAEGWMRARDLARPSLAAPPDEIGGEGTLERWIDVELASQTLTAYEGTRPVFATLVSTGRGAQGSESATPKGAHRIWVKLVTSTMDNVDDEDATAHYSIEDVPWVQFFDRGVALHAAFWHKDFGRVHSHGCVNLSPPDAEWLFGFTGPRLLKGLHAVLPVADDKGTLVRVR